MDSTVRLTNLTGDKLNQSGYIKRTVNQEKSEYPLQSAIQKARRRKLANGTSRRYIAIYTNPCRQAISTHTIMRSSPSTNTAQAMRITSALPIFFSLHASQAQRVKICPISLEDIFTGAKNTGTNKSQSAISQRFEKQRVCQSQRNAHAPTIPKSRT